MAEQLVVVLGSIIWVTQSLALLSQTIPFKHSQITPAGITGTRLMMDLQSIERFTGMQNPFNQTYP
jgi:hypothetical protein